VLERGEIARKLVAILGVPKSNPSIMSGTILRLLARAVSISRRNQSAGSPQRSSAEGEQDKEVRPRGYIPEYDALEVASGDTE